MAKKATKRALLFSVLSLVLCMSMFVGTTYAWFTDSVTSANNIIQSGNLDMKVSFKPYGADNTNWTVVDESTKVFKDGALYEPGYTEAVWFKVENVGSLAFKYNMFLNVNEEIAGVNQAGESFKLSDLLVVKTVAITDVAGWESFYSTRESLNGFNFAEQTLTDSVTLAKNNVIVAEGEPLYVLAIVELPTEVGNVANHNGKNLPSINFALTAMATQVVEEEDSFDNQYDADADAVQHYFSGEHTLNDTLIATGEGAHAVLANGAGTVLNITGGYYDGGDNGSTTAVYAQDGAVINISGGTFKSGEGNAAVYARGIGTKINISGGHFEVDGPYLGTYFVLNLKDNTGAQISVTGGTFVNFNPADNKSENPAVSFVADGYHVEKTYKANGDIWYTVVEGKATTKNADNLVVDEGAKVELKDETLKGTVTNNGGNLTVTDTAITGNITNNGGDMTVTGTTVHNEAAHSYGGTLVNGSYTVFEDVTITNATGGGINVGNGEAVFESGIVDIQNTKSRHMFYVGTNSGFAKLTINDGTFNLKNKTTTSSYLVAAGDGAVIIVNGGNFNAASSKKAPVQELNGGEVIIYGGTFAFDPTEWVADGYEAVKTGDVWVVSAK